MRSFFLGTREHLSSAVTLNRRQVFRKRQYTTDNPTKIIKYQSQDLDTHHYLNNMTNTNDDISDDVYSIAANNSNAAVAALQIADQDVYCLAPKNGDIQALEDTVYSITADVSGMHASDDAIYSIAANVSGNRQASEEPLYSMAVNSDARQVNKDDHVTGNGQLPFILRRASLSAGNLA